MPVVGILCCEIFERELAALLGEIPGLSSISVLESTAAHGLIRALEARGVTSLRRIPHLSSFRRESVEKLEVLVSVLGVGLHNKKQLFEKELVSAAHALEWKSDALLLGYGMCGNVLKNPKELLDVRIPVFIPMDNDHPFDDCVGMLLGGRECYYQEQCKAPGTFFFTPGWCRHWRGVFEGQGQRSAISEDDAKVLFEGYDRALLVVTPVASEAEMRSEAGEFVEMLGLRVEVRQGTVDALKKAWEEARTWVETKRADACLE